MSSRRKILRVADMPPLDPEGTYFWRDSFFPINGVWLMDRRRLGIITPSDQHDSGYRAFLAYNDEGLVRLVGKTTDGYVHSLTSGLYTLHDTLDDAITVAIAKDKLLS